MVSVMTAKTPSSQIGSVAVVIGVCTPADLHEWEYVVAVDAGKHLRRLRNLGALRSPHSRVLQAIELLDAGRNFWCGIFLRSVVGSQKSQALPMQKGQRCRQ